MTNSFVILELEPSVKKRGGSFYASASFKIDNIPMAFDSVEVKIDSGCSISTIPLRRYGIAESICRRLKEQDIADNRDYVISYGVETGGLRHPSPRTPQEKIDCPAMKFLHNVSGFQLEGVLINVKDIYINYNRSGYALIGMDILEKLDIHMGESRINGKQLLLACPKDNIVLEYRQALEKHFG